MIIHRDTYLRLIASRNTPPDLAAQAIRKDHGNGWVEVDAAFLGDPTPPPPPPPTSGPGTELKKLLKTIGITATPTCSCNARAAQMDEWGPDVCEQKIPEIVDWLAGEAKARRLPFIRLAGEQVVKLAIRRARRSAAQ